MYFIFIRETSGYQWIEKEVLEQELVEKITDKEYQSLVIALERLLSIPFSYKAKDFISKYRKPLLSQSQNQEIPKVKYGEDGRAYITTYGEYICKFLKMLACLVDVN